MVVDLVVDGADCDNARVNDHAIRTARCVNLMPCVVMRANETPSNSHSRRPKSTALGDDALIARFELGRGMGPCCVASRMPSQLHECSLLLFRNRPVLAAELLRDALQLELPAYTEARIESAELTQVQPAEYRADLVVLLDADQRPVFGIIVEVQLAPDEDKRFSWPVYAVDLRARKRCPVCVLVFSAHEHVVRWAAKPIELGPGNLFSPLVIGPSGVPAITDVARAAADPELAVLSAMAHGQDSDTESALRIAVAAMAASVGLEPERSMLYCDLVLASLSEAARKALLAMDPAKYEFQSEFAQRYLSQGRAEGRSEGRAEGRSEGRVEGEAGVLIKQLTLKFGSLSQTVIERIRSASLAELDRWTEHVLTATALDDVLR